VERLGIWLAVIGTLIGLVLVVVFLWLVVTIFGN